MSVIALSVVFLPEPETRASGTEVVATAAASDPIRFTQMEPVPGVSVMVPSLDVTTTTTAPPPPPPTTTTTAPPPPPPAPPAAPPATGGPTDAQLEALRQCESGGNYQSNTGNGYYGAYQFSAGTWRSMGTGVDRADHAEPAVQDDAARRLIIRSGWGQFPACSRKIGAR